MGFGIMSRMKQWFGGSRVTNFTVTGLTSIALSDDVGGLSLTGTATIATITANPATRGGRLLYLYGASGTTTFTNNASSTTAGQMDLGAGDATIGATDFVILWLRTDGVWIRATPVADN